jgi:putative ABC transport system substrate-binding protein
MNHRRQLLVAIGASAFTVPLVSFAQQQGKVWRVGFLSQRGRPASIDADFYGGFPRGMRELGYVEGKNLTIEWRFADGNLENLSAQAAELARLNVDLILTAGDAATKAAQRATTTIPIVIGAAADPVGNGLVASLARPGGNTTGLSNLSGDLRPKHLEMLIGMMPKLTRVAVLANPVTRIDVAAVKILEAAAQKTNVKLLSMQAGTAAEIDSTFATISREGAGAVIVTLNPLYVQQRRQIAELAAKYRLASIAPNSEYAEAGGLMSYGQNQSENYRRAATYVDKIFKGAKPADLPIEQPTKLELIINGKTAKALGLTIPQTLLISADKVIE